MKPSFVNNHGHFDLSLSDYQLNINQFRSIATNLWRDNCLAYTDQTGFNVEVPPAFFIDKYGFRCWLDKTFSTIQSELVSVPESDFTNLFKSYDETVRKSVIGSKILSAKPPSVDETVYRSFFLNEQFDAWQKHLARNGIDLPTELIDWYFSVPLLNVYRNSVFYPRFPVLWGPNYFGKIADCDRGHILSKHGEGAVWDFYFLMMVCHEQSHLIQKGEPILSEIAHAILWIDFVIEQELKPFQVNSETGKTCNIEAPFILDRIDTLKGLNYDLLFKDSKLFFEQEVSDSEYSHFVALAFLVHAGVLRYRYLTNLFCGLLAGDLDIIKYLRSDVLRHLSEVFSALSGGNGKLALRYLVKSHMPTFGTIEP